MNPIFVDRIVLYTIHSMLFLLFINSSCVPSSIMPFFDTTTIRSASLIVAKRWAITRVVRPTESSFNACWIACSVSVSKADVASSKINILGFFLRRSLQLIIFVSVHLIISHHAHLSMYPFLLVKL